MEVEPTGHTGGLERYLPVSYLNNWGIGSAVHEDGFIEGRWKVGDEFSAMVSELPRRHVL